MVWNREGWHGFFDKLIEIWCWCWYGIADRIKYKYAYFKWLKKVAFPSRWSGSRLIIDYAEPLISIIMPTIGRDATKAVQSVLKQTYKNWELIIVCDGRECGLNFGKCLASKYIMLLHNKIRFFVIDKKLHYPDQSIYHWLVGPVNAINYGLSKVRGAWIARIDDDDEWESDHLKVALKDALSFNKDFVSYGIDLNGKIPDSYEFYGKKIGAVQTWLYRSYLKCFKYSKHSWRWRPGNNDIDLPRRMARARVDMEYWPVKHATVKPRPGLTETGKKGWMEECLQKRPSWR